MTVAGTGPAGDPPPAAGLRRIPFPFPERADSVTGNNLEIFHVSHGKWETAAPIRAFVPYQDGRSILASYTCTPVVPGDPNYYNIPDVHYAQRVTFSGEFLHAAPWNHSLGAANISHGCVNLSVADAEWVYHTFLIGDVVEVVHSPKPLPLTDGLGDWTVSYDKYGHSA